MLVEIVLFLCITILLWKLVFPSSKLAIPGPRPLPLLGNTLQLDLARPYVTTAQWTKKYGDIFKLYLGPVEVVAVSGTELLHEMCITKGKEFAGRPVLYRMVAMIDNKDLVLGPYGERHTLLKKVFAHGLKQHNLKLLESLALDCIHDIVDEIVENGSDPIDPKNIIEDMLLNTVFILLMKRKPNAEKQELKMLERAKVLLSEIAAFVGTAPLLDTFPWLRFFGNRTYRQIQEHKAIWNKLFSDWEEEVKEGSLSDCWFADLVTQKLPHNIPDRGTMLALTYDYFTAGVATTGGVVLSLLHVMVHYPEVQKRVHSEVEAIDTEVLLSDRDSLPYTNACLLEGLRYMSLQPFMAHYTTVDTSLGGYQIPKGTMVMMQLWAQHHNPELWPNPFEFQPERFLKDDGSLVLPDEVPRNHLFAFGGGPRLCAGDTFGMTRMFTILATLVKRFEIHPATRIEEQPTCHPLHAFRLGALLMNKPYKVRFIPRA
jgi:cytochrome P450